MLLLFLDALCLCFLEFFSSKVKLVISVLDISLRLQVDFSLAAWHDIMCV
jgi:hypothetical protein